MNSEDPPEDPHLTSEIVILSPASPKPIHFPAPADIPVLDKMMDVGFNQTETHMDDPATRNTELRAGAWQDPDAPSEEVADGNVATKEGAMAQQDRAAGSGEHISAVDDAYTTTTTEPADVLSVLEDAAAESVTYLDQTASTTDPTSLHADLTYSAPDAIAAQPTAFSLNANVDVQALLSTLRTSTANTPVTNVEPNNPPLNVATTATTATPIQAQANVPGLDSSPVSIAGLGAPPLGLPPRPPPQEQPLINANYAHSQHIRDYHPHAANPALQPANRSHGGGNAADPASNNFVPPVLPLQPSHPSASPYAHAGSPSLKSPTTSTFPEQDRVPSAATLARIADMPLESRREYKLALGLKLDEDDMPWTKDTQQKYDKFIEDERKYVSEGRWEQFPYGSRLFVGNLSSEKVTKRDIFHVFHVYGELAQISIKQAYGFVQFLNARDCAIALGAEEGRQVRDKKIHLEVSKPQKNRQQAQEPRTNQQSTARRRSRSPEPSRTSRNDYGHERERDQYRPYRSPSPRRDTRDRYRDRSPEQYGRNGRSDYGRSADPDDELPLPRRAPGNVPDVQILVLDSLHRDFTAWVQGIFEQQGLKVETLILSTRLDPDQVIRRQLLEGVLAVCRLDRNHQNSGKVDLRVFNRSAGAMNVTYDDYDNQDPQICAALALRAKQQSQAQVQQRPPPQQYNGYQPPSQYSAAPPLQQQQHYPTYPPQLPQQSYPYAPAPSSYPPQATYPQPTSQQAPSQPPNLQQLITNLDPAGLQSLLSAMGQQQPPAQTPQAAANGHGQGVQVALGALQRDPGLVAGLLQQQQQAQQQRQNGQSAGVQSAGGAGGGVNMQEILARLGTYGGK
ncbi:hypothetical protein B0A48_06950 [Cryoendolithus antarcticus]|uniref:RRM domain-containing protein n=1 Tax=Cryoendolithus antarcticus TaxID=1507870 RepID=A0A1V8T9T7_9PEZI|nr:hypothetical protein B0A48_06950 [Cryoendolithus antarcticus]